MPDNYYTTALRNGTVYELRINDDDDGYDDDDENAKHKSKERRGCVVIIKRGSGFFFFLFHPRPPLFLNLFFALFSIHPVDYKYFRARNGDGKLPV